MTEVIGVVLAGGLSRRYGSPKAFAKTEDGRYFYEKAVAALSPVCSRIVIVSRPELLPYFNEKFDVITDLSVVAGQGPLAGIYTAMTERTGNRYVVLPCDMPYIRHQEVKKLVKLIRSADVTAVRTESELIPLFSIWSPHVKEKLETALTNGQKSVIAFLADIDTEWVDAATLHNDSTLFRNINRPAEKKGESEGYG